MSESSMTGLVANQEFALYGLNRRFSLGSLNQ